MRHPASRYEAETPPLWSEAIDHALVRGYGTDHVIRYETGRVVTGSEIAVTCHRILQEDAVAYVHVRSKFNCFLWQVDRDSPRA